METQISHEEVFRLFEELFRQSAAIRANTKLLAEAKNPRFTIVDTTEESIGKATIITGVKPPAKHAP